MFFVEFARNLPHRRDRSRPRSPLASVQRWMVVVVATLPLIQGSSGSVQAALTGIKPPISATTM